MPKSMTFYQLIFLIVQYPLKVLLQREINYRLPVKAYCKAIFAPNNNFSIENIKLYWAFFYEESLTIHDVNKSYDLYNLLNNYFIQELAQLILINIEHSKICTF